MPRIENLTRRTTKYLWENWQKFKGIGLGFKISVELSGRVLVRHDRNIKSTEKTICTKIR